MTTAPKQSSVFRILRGIQGRLTLFSLLFALIPLLIVGTLSFTAARDSLRQQATTVTAQLLESVSTDVQSFFFERRGDIRVLANAEILIHRDEHGPEEANHFLKEVKAAYGIYLMLIATDTSGQVVASTDLVSNDMTGERWFTDAIRGIVSVSDVYYLTSIQRMVITIASPMIGENGQIVGAVAGHIDAEALFEIAERAQSDQGGEVLFVNSEGRVSIDGEAEDIFVDLSENPAVQAGLRGERGTLIATNEEGQESLIIYSPSEGTQKWVALATIELASLDAPANDLAARLIGTGALVAAIVIVAAFLLSRQFVSPIQELTHTARLLSNGNLEAPITVRSRDEIGSLADAFRYMAAQLRDLVNSLEDRVSARTRDLEAVADVSTQIATVLEPETLLTDVANLTKQRFGFYHAHIYLLDPAGQKLTMEGGAGEAGRLMKANKHAIPLSRQHSLVVRAATSGKPIIANDVSKEPDFLPNPLLPQTRSEMAIPMKIGERVIGVLDVQADATDAFAEDNARVMQTLANQIAVAAENAGAFQRIQESQKALLDMRFALDQHSIVAITDQRGIIQYANDKFSEISGYTIDELIGQDHRIINSGYHSKEFIRNLWTTLANGKVWKGEFQNRAKNGSLYWVDTTIIPFLNEQGKPFQYIAIRTDITERKHQEQEITRRATELEVAARVSAASTSILDVDELLLNVANLTKESFGLYHAHVYLLDAANEYLVLAAGAGEAGRIMKEQGRRIALNNEHSLVARAARSRQGVIANDVTQEADFLPNPLLPATRSEMAIPMIVGDHVIGVLDVQADIINRFDADDVRVKSTLANQIAVAVENARAFERIESSEREMKNLASFQDAILNGSDYSIISTDLDGTILTFNAAAEQMLGYRAEEVVGKTTPAILHDIDEVIARAQILTEELGQPIEPGFDVFVAKPRLQGVADENEWTYIRKDGSRFPVLLSVTTIRDSAGNITGYTGMSTDITERKRQEAEIIRRATEMEVAARVSAASTSILDVDELLLNVANLTKESFGLYHAHVYLLDAANEYLVLAAGAGEAGRIMKEQGRRIALNNEHSLVARAAREKTGAIVNDVSKEPDFLPNPLLPATRSEMAIPMIVGDHVIGVLDVQADIINRFDADDVRVKSTLANQIAVAVENARAFESVERSREEVSRVYNLSVDMIGTASHTGYFQELNPAWSATLGWSMEELKSRPFIEFVHPDDRQPTLDEYARQIRSGAASISFENRYLCKDGSFRWLSWNAVPFAQEGLTYFVTRDVTTEKETEESIRAARNRAETLASINAALSQAANESEILDAIAPLAEAQGVWASSLMYPSMKDGQLLGAEAVSVRMGDGQNLTQSIGTTFISLAEFPLFNLISNYPDDLLFIEDWETSPLGNEAERQYTQNVGIRAAILIRLRTGQDWHGLLTFNWSEPKAFSQDLRDIFAAVIPTATSVVAARRAFLESQRQRTEAEKRAIELAIVAEVSSTAATQLNPTELLSSVVDLTKGAFNLYHAHIYLADEENANLVLAAGAGEAGRIMLQQGRRIPMDRVNSLVAQAARERYPVISNNVAEESHFLPNPLLPDTRSEMSVPMVVGDKLIGVLDVQASQINHFTESDALIFRTLGDQLAIAIENARAFQLQQETAERLREVDRLKSQFLANMSHELRTPLNSIIGYSEVLLDGLDGDLTEDAIEDVEAIHNGGKHLLSIINDVLDLAKIEAGQMHMDRREADVATVIEDVVSTVQILIKDKPDLVLEVHVPENLPTVYGDMLRMKQMMMNLVNNAIKFTESGSVRIEAAPHNGHEVAIRVTDSGIGMNEREVAGLFQQFHQVDGSPTRRAGGTGLGLVITRHLIHMHEGEIYVESEKGVGSSFWFTLPIFAERMAERA